MDKTQRRYLVGSTYYQILWAQDKEIKSFRWFKIKKYMYRPVQKNGGTVALKWGREGKRGGLNMFNFQKSSSQKVTHYDDKGHKQFCTLYHT